MTDSKEAIVTHSIITPWPISQTIHTWCGLPADSKALRDHMVATSPESINCGKCLSAMKQARKNLDEWLVESS